MRIAAAFVIILAGVAVSSSVLGEDTDYDPGAIIVVDGEVRAIGNRPNWEPFERIEVLNGGRLDYLSLHLHSSLVRVDSKSVLSTGEIGSGYPYTGVNGIDGTASGGSYAGRGGGPAPGTPLNRTNGLRRRDEWPWGGYGGSGPDRTLGPNVTLAGGYGGRPGFTLEIMADEVDIQGTVHANGKKGEAASLDRPETCATGGPLNFCDCNAGGGGSGGAVLILARNLIVGASATIRANGGDGGEPKNTDTAFHDFKPGFAGGGGRVKIYYERGTIDPRATIEAKAGWDPHTPEELWGMWAEDGTVYVRQVNNIDHLFKPSGDINNDGVVDKEDLLHLMTQWGNVEPTHTPTVTPTQVPTDVPTPTRTARPTWTPTPTATPTATPAETATPTTTPAPTAEPTPESSQESNHDQ